MRLSDDPRNKTATCTEGGVEVWKCSRCNEVELRSTNPLNHLPAANTDEAATCMKDGKTGGTHCGRCGVELTPATVVSAHGHEPIAYTDDNPTSSAASGTHSWTCSLCHGEETGGTASGSHTYNTDANKAFTACGTPAGETGKWESRTLKCDNCDHTYTETRKVGSKNVSAEYWYGSKLVKTDRELGAIYEFATGGDTTKTVNASLPAGYKLAENEAASKTATWNNEVVRFNLALESYNLTVVYRGLPSNLTPANSVSPVEFEADITNVAIPEVAGYTGAANADNPKTMPAANTTIYVDYTVNYYELTVVYTGLPASLAIPDSVSRVATGAPIAVSIPNVAGYTGAARSTNPATMPAAPLTVYVDYSIIAEGTYQLYINYVYEDGTTAASTYSAVLNEGDDFSVTSPVIEGYTPDQEVVSGYMGASTSVLVVTYTADAPIEEPDVPLVENPEEPEQPELPEEPLPEEPIEEPDVPLAEEPDVEIGDTDVPLADVPKTGDNSWIWSVTAALSGIGLVYLALKDRKRKADAE